MIIFFNLNSLNLKILNIMEEQLQITASFKEQMLGARKWLKFLTILCTIGMAFMVLAGIVMLFVPSIGGAGAEAIPGVFLGIMYLILALIYLYPIKKCFALVGNIDRAMKQDAQNDLELMAQNTHSVLKFFGIISIIVLCLYVVAIIAAIVGAILGISALSL